MGGPKLSEIAGPDHAVQNPGNRLSQERGGFLLVLVFCYGVKKFECVTQGPPSILMSWNKHMTLIRVDDMFNVSPLTMVRG